MGALGLDGQDAATATLLITAAGWLAFNYAVIAYLIVVWPAQILADRHHVPNRGSHAGWLTGVLIWLASGLVICGLTFVSDMEATNLPTGLMLGIPITAPVVAGAVAVASAKRWRRWLRADPGGRALSTPAQTALSTQLATYDYWRMGWWLGIPAIVVLGAALTPHFGIAALALMWGILLAWLTVSLLARRVAVQLDPLNAFVRAYRAHAREIESGRSRISFTLSRDPWTLAHGERVDIEKRLLDVAALRLVRQVRKLPATLSEGCRNGCGQLLHDVGAAPTNRTLLRGLFICCVSGPFPYDDTPPELELGSTTRDWRTFAWIATIGAAISSVTTAHGAVRAVA